MSNIRADIRAEWERTGRCAAPTSGSNGYQLGCRCNECKDGHRARMMEQRAARAALCEAGKMPAKAHGASGYVNWGCRCAKCVRGHARRYKAWYSQHRRVRS